MANFREPKIEPMLTVADVCRYLSVTDETVYSWIKNRSLPAARVGRRWMFQKEKLDAWINAGYADDSPKD